MTLPAVVNHMQIKIVVTVFHRWHSYVRVFSQTLPVGPCFLDVSGRTQQH